MKNKLSLWLASAAFAAILFTACSKEETAINSNPSNSELSVPEIDALSNEADQEFANFSVEGGTETEGFYSNEFGLPDAYQVNENTADEIMSVKRDGNAKRLRNCLSKLELSNDQIAKIRRIFSNYSDCKSSIEKRYRHAMAELTTKFNIRHEELLKALKNGRITKEEFEKHMKAMRIEFNRAQHELAKHARLALKACYIKMLRGLHSVLTERQWKAFAACYRK